MRLKELRIKKNLRQEDVAQMLGVERSTYTKYESGASRPKNEILIELSNFYNVSVDYILETTDKKEKPTPMEGDGLNEEQLELIRRYDAATPELRAAALAVLRSAESQSKAPGEVSTDK